MMEMKLLEAMRRLKARVAALRSDAERRRCTSEQAVAYLPHLFVEARDLDKRAAELERALEVLGLEARPGAVVKDEEFYE